MKTTGRKENFLELWKFEKLYDHHGSLHRNFQNHHRITPSFLSLSKKRGIQNQDIEALIRRSWKRNYSPFASFDSSEAYLPITRFRYRPATSLAIWPIHLDFSIYENTHLVHQYGIRIFFAPFVLTRENSSSKCILVHRTIGIQLFRYGDDECGGIVEWLATRL